MAVAYGTLSNVNQVTTTTTVAGTQSAAAPATVSFVANQVLAGSSVQGSGLDRVSGIVAARSGDTLAVEDATLVSAAGLETFLGGTTTVLMGANTLVTVFGQGGTQLNSTLQVSVGSAIDALPEWPLSSQRTQRYWMPAPVTCAWTPPRHRASSPHKAPVP